MAHAEGNAFRIGNDHLNDFFVYSRITDNTLFADFFASCLKLRLDQSCNFAVLFHQIPDRKQHLGQGDKRYVDRYEGRSLLDILRHDVTDVRALHTDNARIVPQLPVELAVTDIHGIYLDGAVLQHTVGKAAGGCSDIHADLSIQGKVKVFHCFL